MKKLLLALAFLLAPSLAFAQCNGVFPANTLCGNLSGAPQPPAAFAASGTVVGPASSGVNDLAGWANIGGTQIKDMAGLTIAGNYIFGGNLVFDGTTTYATVYGTTSIRQVLTASTTINVDAALGTDQVGCGTATGASACHTPQYVINFLSNLYDLGNQAVTIKLADSGSHYGPAVASIPWVGGNNVTLLGDNGSPTSVVIDGAAGPFCVAALNYAALTVSGVTVQNCALEIAAPELFGQIYFENINFAAPIASGVSIYCSRQSYCEAIGGGNTIAAVGSNFIQASHQGNFRAAEVGTGASGFTLTANITLAAGGAFGYSTAGGDITFTGYNSSVFNLNGHTVTGSQWLADSNGIFQILNNSGASLTVNFFPGSSQGHCNGDCAIDQGAHASPTLSSCGTGSPTVVGTDYYGQVTEGTSATGCVLNFQNTFTQAPYCVFSWYTAAPSTVVASSSVSAFSLTHGSASASVFDYHCKGF